MSSTPSYLECFLNIKDLAIYFFEFCLHSYWSVTLLNKEIRLTLEGKLTPIKRKLYKTLANRYINNCTIVENNEIYKFVDANLNFETFEFSYTRNGGITERILFNAPCKSETQYTFDYERCGKCGEGLKYGMEHHTIPCNLSKIDHKKSWIQYQKMQCEMKKYIYEIMYCIDDEKKAYLQWANALDWRKSEISMTALWRLSELRYPVFRSPSPVYIVLTIGERDLINRDYRSSVFPIQTSRDRKLICEMVNIEELLQYNTDTLCVLKFILRMTLDKPHMNINHFIRDLKIFRIAHKRSTFRLKADLALGEKIAPGVEKTLESFLKNYLVPMDYRLSEAERLKMERMDDSEDELSEERSSDEDEEDSGLIDIDYVNEVAKNEQDNILLEGVNYGVTQEPRKRKIDEVYQDTTFPKEE